MKEKHFYSFDILKFACSILIVIHHFQQNIDIQFRHIDFFNGKFYFGYLVELFFIISGYISKTKQEKMLNSDFFSFIKRKILRFLPMCFISISAVLLLEAIHFFLFGSALSKGGLGIWKIINNYFLVFSGWVFNGGYHPGVNDSLWTICVLLLCYCAFYFVSWVCKKKQLNYFLFAIPIIMISYWMIEEKIYLPFASYTSLRGYTSFFLGTILFTLFDYLDRNVNKYISFLFGILILVGIIGAGILNFDQFFDNTRSIMTYIVFPIILYLSLYFEKQLSVVNGLAVHMGELSYEIYIWHIFFIRLLYIVNKVVIEKCSGTGLINKSTNPFVIISLFLCGFIIFSDLFIKLDKRISFLSMVDNKTDK